MSVTISGWVMKDMVGRLSSPKTKMTLQVKKQAVRVKNFDEIIFRFFGLKLQWECKHYLNISSSILHNLELQPTSPAVACFMFCFPTYLKQLYYLVCSAWSHPHPPCGLWRLPGYATHNLEGSQSSLFFCLEIEHAYFQWTCQVWRYLYSIRKNTFWAGKSILKYIS